MMSKEYIEQTQQFIITQYDEKQTIAALFQGQRLLEYRIDSPQHRSLVGNIYRGQVRRVLPQMQAVFVDIGLSEPGFLAARDAVSSKGVGKLQDINTQFHEGQTVWVQVRKDALASSRGLETKGVRLTTELSLETPHLVFLPQSSGISLSKQITDQQRRQVLKKHVQDAMAEHAVEGGFIVRSVLANSDPAVWLADVATLWGRWQLVKQAMQTSKKLELVHQNSSLLECLAQQSQVHADTQIVGLESAEPVFQRAGVNYTVLSAAELAAQLAHLELARQLEQAQSSVIKLPNGGSIVIDKTEALVVVDVNIGAAVQQSALAVNLQAADMIAQQLRLRNLAGMVVIDFLRMQNKKERQTLLQKMQQRLSEDAVKTQVYGYTRLGLLELSRERIYPDLASLLAGLSYEN